MDDKEASVIEAQNLGRRFGRFWAVRDVTFQVRRSEIFGLVGPDGAGKTTLLQMLAAILDPTEGRCVTLGRDTVHQASDVTAQIGYMPQGFTLYDQLTVAENLSFAAKIRGVTASEFDVRIPQLLSMAGLSSFLNRREGALSGGMRKKLALCTNLIHQPPLLLLDEPGLGVDPLSRRELWLMLENFRRKGITIVFSTSYMDEAERCDKVVFLNRGHAIAEGAPGELQSRGRNAVFSLSTDEHASVSRQLPKYGILGIKWQPTELRIVIDRNSLSPSQLRSALASVGSPKSVDPEMQDVFVLLSANDTDDTRELVADAVLQTQQVSVPAGATLVEAHDLTRRFGNFTAVSSVSLTVSSGEIVGLLGANGAGKTTLIRMLCGLLPPSHGTAHVAGLDVVRDVSRVRQNIGYMSQRFSLYLDLTAAENLAFFASAYGLERRRARAAIDWVRQAAGLERLYDKLVGELSGAERQRVALACSILHRPKVLFLDEPTSGVDPLARYHFWRLVMMLSRTGTGIMVTTHNLEEAVYCHRLGLMHQGGLIAMGDLASLRSGLGPDSPASAEDIFISYIQAQSPGESDRDAGPQ